MFTQILPSPFRKRIRKRQRKESGHITAKPNFIHKEMFSKSFLRQQRQQFSMYMFAFFFVPNKSKMPLNSIIR